jgi:putative FmdB family regulatory protein
MSRQVICKGELPMPIYEYKCSACGSIFEILSTSCSHDEVVQCRNCQSRKVNKIMSASSFRRGFGTPLPAAAPASCGNKSGFS